jgi:hypothetical protein
MMKLCYTDIMKKLITAKLTLHTTSEQFATLRRIQLAYRDVLHYVSQYAFKRNKMRNKVSLQERTYTQPSVLQELTSKANRFAREFLFICQGCPCRYPCCIAQKHFLQEEWVWLLILLPFQRNAV